MRKHQFSPLETIAIFTITDSVPLTEVLHKMHAIKDTNPPVSTKVKHDELRRYFNTVLPDHDPTRVYPKDIIKIIKWFHFLNERNLLSSPADEEE